MNETKIMVAEETDFDAINQVIKKHNLTPLKYYKPVPMAGSSDVMQKENQIVFISKNHDEITGFLTLHSDSGKSFKQTVNIDDHVASFEIVVNPDFQKQGIGKKLLERAIQYSMNETDLKRIETKIKKGNDASKKLCENCGFYLLCCESMGFTMVLNLIRNSAPDTGDNCK